MAMMGYGDFYVKNKHGLRGTAVLFVQRCSSVLGASYPGEEGGEEAREGSREVAPGESLSY
jgi:hypothetical protein